MAMVYAEAASALLDRPELLRKCSLGCARLDACLGGGVDAQGITEVAGEAGAGKTQLALQLTLQAMLPPSLGGLGGGALILHTDSADFSSPMKRLTSLAQQFASRHAALGATTGQLLERIWVMQIDEHEELWNVVHTRLPALLEQDSIRLIVLDSIAAPFRTSAEEAMAADLAPRAAAHAERAQQLLRLAARLKQISDAYNVAVPVTNQVSDKPIDARQRVGAAPWELATCPAPDGPVRVPALGLSWAGCVNSRLLLSRRDAPGAAGHDQQNSVASSNTRLVRPRHDCVDTSMEPEKAVTPSASSSAYVRHLRVAWSPRLPSGRSMRFEVRECGLVGCG